MTDSGNTMHVAVVGCSHGELDNIYESIKQQEDAFGFKTDLLLCCGDFQAIRNLSDLRYLHCPEKYRRLGDFGRYYSGEKTAPVFTILIGGNHESSAYHMELPHGGWLAPSIYYLGFSSVVSYGGLRICGWSGIFKAQDYNYHHFECPPFPRGQQVSAYHVRSVDCFRISLLNDNKPNCVDVIMSHDWPVGITKFGQEAKLLAYKKHFTNDIRENRLGNPHSMGLLQTVRPRYWFSGHLHAKFEAEVPHKGNDERENSKTKFLALHKCDPQRPNKYFLDILKLPVLKDEPKELFYDARWLAILRKTSELEISDQQYAQIPANVNDYYPSDADLKEVEELFGGDLKVPTEFTLTAPPYTVPTINRQNGSLYYRNPQTKIFCEKLGLPDLNEQLCRSHIDMVGNPYYIEQQVTSESNTNEIPLDDDDLFGDDDFIVDVRGKRSADDVENGSPTATEEKRCRVDDDAIEILGKMSFRSEIASICLRVSASAVVIYFSMKYITRFLDPNYALKQEAKKKVEELVQRLQIDFPLELNEYELRIATQLVPPDEGVNWSSIGGYEDVIDELEGRVVMPLRARAAGRLPASELFNPAQGILLHGPPGCGKTLFARAIAREASARFIQLDLSTLTDKWYGESQKLVAAVFSLAKKMQPCIIFVDEIDSFLRSRQSTDNEATAMMKAQFMSLWDGFSSGGDVVIVMGATNRPYDVDSAILRRMPTRFHVQMPDEKARASILKTILRGENAEEKIDYDHVARVTNNMSGSDLKEVCRLAAINRLRDAEKLSKTREIDIEHITIREGDLIASAKRYCSELARPSSARNIFMDEVE